MSLDYFLPELQRTILARGRSKSCRRWRLIRQKEVSRGEEISIDIARSHTHTHTHIRIRTHARTCALLSSAPTSSAYQIAIPRSDR